MKKVIVIGCPGSGKSTFSRALHSLTGIPLFYLDQMNWNADRTTVDPAVFLQRLTESMEQDAWILDGNYGQTLERRLQHCDTVFFLDYPVEVCLAGIESRKGKPRPDMPWIEPEDEIDWAFLDFIKSFHTQVRPDVLALLEKYRDRTVVIFHSREEADAYLKENAPRLSSQTPEEHIGGHDIDL